MGRGKSGKSQSVYERFPVAVRLGGGTAEEKKQKTETVTRFMNNAKAGDVYTVGGGIGSAGGAKFEVVAMNRSPNKMGLRWVGDGGYSNTVVMSRANVAKYISNGAAKVKKTKRQ